jgi:hypothetical protein
MHLAAGGDQRDAVRVLVEVHVAGVPPPGIAAVDQHAGRAAASGLVGQADLELALLDGCLVVGGQRRQLVVAEILQALRSAKRHADDGVRRIDPVHGHGVSPVFTVARPWGTAGCKSSLW